jgi:putative PIN family toxin of toxin-antitoxin system
VRVVIDTNILISALFAETSLPAHLVALWREGEFDLLTSKTHIAEVIRVTRYPKIRARLIPAVAGRLINELRDVAITVKRLPTIAVSPDPHDNYLLATASAGAADFLITGDKRDLLALRIYEGTKIITVRDFLALHQRLP